MHVQGNLLILLNIFQTPGLTLTALFCSKLKRSGLERNLIHGLFTKDLLSG